MASKKVLKQIKYFFALIILGFLFWYLFINWKEFKPLLNLSVSKLIFLYIISSAGVLITGLTNKLLLSSLAVKTKYWDMVLLQNAVYLLNYVPMKFGTLFRANYLKKHYGLSYTRFGTFFTYITLIMTFTTPITGLVVLVVIYGLNFWPAQILAIAFLFSLIISGILLFVPVNQIKGQNKIVITINNFLKGRNEIIKNKKTLLYCAVLMNVNFVLGSLRLGIIYFSLGQNVNPAGYLIIGALGYFLMFISLTPGSIGIRELVVGATSVVIDVPMKIGVPVAMIDRAIAITYAFVVGGICALCLWFKSPQDFKNLEDQKSISSLSSQPDQTAS